VCCSSDAGLRSFTLFGLRGLRFWIISVPVSGFLYYRFPLRRDSGWRGDLGGGRVGDDPSCLYGTCRSANAPPTRYARLHRAFAAWRPHSVRVTAVHHGTCARHVGGTRESDVLLARVLRLSIYAYICALCGTRTLRAARAALSHVYLYAAAIHTYLYGACSKAGFLFFMLFSNSLLLLTSMQEY